MNNKLYVLLKTVLYFFVLVKLTSQNYKRRMVTTIIVDT